MKKNYQTKIKIDKKRQIEEINTTTIVRNLGTHSRRILFGHATLGVVRYEWHAARIGLVIPINWANTDIVVHCQPNSMVALGYQVADAQNVIIENALNGNYEYCLLYEDDVLPPMNALLILSEYLDKAEVPIVSGLYFSRGNPTWPLVFRGRGNGAFYDFQFGEKLWVDGVPTGFVIIHRSILQYLWDNSPEYAMPDGQKLHRVFEFPRKSWYDPEQNRYFSEMGTSDLALCNRIMKDEIFKKTGWTQFAKKKYPFLVDTRIFCRHIDLKTGIIYPDQCPAILMKAGQKLPNR